LSTLVAAKLQLIQQWWLPIVNGWCQPFAAHAMATTQQASDLNNDKENKRLEPRTKTIPNQKHLQRKI
jgi:hypothetical protein